MDSPLSRLLQEIDTTSSPLADHEADCGFGFCHIGTHFLLRVATTLQTCFANIIPPYSQSFFVVFDFKAIHNSLRPRNRLKAWEEPAKRILMSLWGNSVG